MEEKQDYVEAFRSEYIYDEEGRLRAGIIQKNYKDGSRFEGETLNKKKNGKKNNNYYYYFKKNNRFLYNFLF